MKKFLLVCSLGLMGLSGLMSQDLHYTLFNFSPLLINPAQSGSFLGTIRIGGIYRDQWGGIVSRQYRTPSFYIDAPIIRGFRKNDWVGIGLNNVTDEAGSLKLKTSISAISGAYHFGLGRDGKSVFTVGIQVGQVERKLKLPTEAGVVVFSDQVNLNPSMGPIGPGAIGQSQDFIDGDPKKSYTDINAGFLLRSKVDNETDYTVGLAFNHIGGPEYNILNKGTSRDSEKRPMRITAHGTYNRKLNDAWSLSPAFLFQNAGTGRELLVQAWAGNQINDDFQLMGGLGYRFGESLQALFGVNYKDEFKAALSYDINTTTLNKGKGFPGSFEIGGYYILKIYKKPNVKPAILCPEF